MASDESRQWQRYAEQARAGEVYLDDEAAARECLAACDKRLDDLHRMRTTANILHAVSGFGDFKMGHDLEAVFKSQATGEPNSIDAVINDNIETVQHMRDVMVQSIRIITGQDVDNAAAIAKTQHQAGR